MVVLATVLLLTATQVADDRVLVLDLKSDDVKDSELFGADLATHLAQSTEYTIATSSDVRTMLRIAGEKQLLGCLDETCAPEVARLLDARHVIHGGVRQVDGAWEIQVVHLDVMQGIPVKRTEERAATVAGLRHRLPALADDLALSLRREAVDAPTTSASLLKNRNDCVWAATRLQRAKERRLRPTERVYVAHFESSHFDLSEFDRMRRALPLGRRALFPGEFPACHGRTMANQDAFLIEDSQKVAILADRALATALSARRKDRKLRLELAFTLVDVSFVPLPPPDTALCGPGERARIPDLSPAVTIRVLGGALVDPEQGSRTPLGALRGDGLSFQPLDDVTSAGKP
jgi:hypothetical protein